MTTSNEHNNGPAVPQGEPVAWQARCVWPNGRKSTKWSLVTATNAELTPKMRAEYLARLTHPDGSPSYEVRALYAATAAPAPAQEFNKSVADAEIKAMYVESQGSEKGWLGIEGSYFIGGVVAARKQQIQPVLTVEKEPDYWSGGHFYEGTKSWINPANVWALPIGTKLYADPIPTPPAPCRGEPHVG